MDILNKEQKSAAMVSYGVSLVIAGAGTGKTKTLVEKIKNQISYSNILPENILILTFSRKAAEEIKDRVSIGIEFDSSNITSGTFHSFCLKIIKDNFLLFKKRFNFKNSPEVISEEMSLELLKKIIEHKKDELLGLPGDVIVKFINEDLNRKYNTDTLNRLIETGLYDEIFIIKKIYSERKRQLCFIDYSDIMNFAIELLKSEQTLRNQLNNHYRYIYIDEFQDTSPDNMELIKLLLPDYGGNLFCVGDDWQSIYGFRNSDIKYIIKMKSFFPEAKIFKLKMNYRSKKEIVDLSNKIIRKNKIRTEKKLKSFKGKGGEIILFNIKTNSLEIEIIKNIIFNKKYEGLSIVVLYRNNWQGKVLSEEIDSIPENVFFMTMHGSKGLEFDVVVLCGIKDNIIPDKNNEIEEERRLYYVAITRAKDKLFIIAHGDGEDELPIFAKESGLKISKFKKYFKINKNDLI